MTKIYKNLIEILYNFYQDLSYLSDIKITTDNKSKGINERMFKYTNLYNLIPICLNKTDVIEKLSYPIVDNVM